MSETGKSDWSTLRVLVVAAGVEGVVAGLVIVVLAAIPLSRTRGYKDLAEENLSDYEMDNYMEAYKFDVRSNGAALLSSLISAVVDGFLVAGAVGNPEMVRWVHIAYMLLYPWVLPAGLIWSLIWSLGGVWSYPGTLLLFLCVLRCGAWLVVHIYGKEVKLREMAGF